ncbi:hypothetical protein [Paenibacillus sp.]|nr:hypothetical protein [Paenibacillus sp.]MDR0271463.1 hypothetical protein [Paenibacillus sp.]
MKAYQYQIVFCHRLVESKDIIDVVAAFEGFSSGSYLHTVFRKNSG